MDSVGARITRFKADLPTEVRLVAISKYHPVSCIREAYAAGQRIFGESRVQELVEKESTLHGTDIEWHFIGHLQTNKVKQIAPFVSLIHAVDSLRLLEEIDRQGARCGRTLRCLLQLHVAKEESKFGLTTDEARELLAQGRWKEFRNVQLCGIMCMASNTTDTARIRTDFREARRFFEEAKRDYFPTDENFRERSYGMSGDWSIALDEGSTMVRIGSAIFGPREY
ncbi:MAG: YggS family pyridoxal phosphate-dependent enzyme [Alloprevotella sp.]|nr:YggS family pyridoxal phosphate-dependent enzyme [Alloprevotella sp.]